MKLEAFRADPPEQPSVVVLPVPRPYAIQRIANTKIEDSLPDAVGAFVAWLIGESKWTVTERPTSVANTVSNQNSSDVASLGEGGSRTTERLVPIQARHICLLFRRFVSYDTDVTRPYVRALEAGDSASPRRGALVPQSSGD